MTLRRGGDESVVRLVGTVASLGREWRDPPLAPPAACSGDSEQEEDRGGGSAFTPPTRDSLTNASVAPTPTSRDWVTACWWWLLVALGGSWVHSRHGGGVVCTLVSMQRAII